MIHSAYAEQGDLHIGLDYGLSAFDTGVSAISGSANLDEEDSGFKLYFGYGLTPNIDLELHFANFGEASLTGNNGDQFTADGETFVFTADNVNITLEGQSFGLSGVISFAESKKLSPFVRLGLHRWEVDVDVNSSLGGGSLDDDGTDIFLGFGANLKVADSVNIRGEYDYLKVDDEDIDYLSLGVLFEI